MKKMITYMVAALYLATSSPAYSMKEDINTKIVGARQNATGIMGLIKTNRFYSKALTTYAPIAFLFACTARVIDHMHRCERWEGLSYPRYARCDGQHAPLTQKVGNFIMQHIWKP